MRYEWAATVSGGLAGFTCWSVEHCPGAAGRSFVESEGKRRREEVFLTPGAKHHLCCSNENPGLRLTPAMVGLGTAGSLPECHQPVLCSWEKMSVERPTLGLVETSPKPGLAGRMCPPPPEQGFQNPKAPRAFLVTGQEGHLWAWHPSPHRPAPGRLGVSAVRKQLPSKRPAEGVLHPGCAQWHVALHIAGKCISRESSPTQTSFTEHPQPQVLDVSTEMLLQGRGIIPGQEWRVTDTQAGARSAPHGTPALA